MNLQQYVTVEYSLTQRCYHISDIRQIIRNNLDMIARDFDNRYLLIGVFESWELASAFVDRHRKMMALRSQPKHKRA